jgi:hypothetical protein
VAPITSPRSVPGNRRRRQHRQLRPHAPADPGPPGVAPQGAARDRARHTVGADATGPST